MGMRSDGRRKVNVLEMKCLRSLVGVSRMNRVRIENVRMRAGMERELASRADQRVLRWFGRVERTDEYRIGIRLLMVEVKWRAGTRETDVRLDGWCEGGLGQQRNDCGGCGTMPERSERGLNPGICVTE